MIVAEITLARKKIFFITVYRSPSQTSEQFEEFIKMQMIFDQIRRERFHSLILTVDLNCRSSLWWDENNEYPEGNALGGLIEMNNLCQLIDKPTNIWGEKVHSPQILVGLSINWHRLFISIMDNIHIDGGKVLQLIRALDSKKANGCDSISVSMINICDMSNVEPLCLIFKKCLETGSYPSIWKKANGIPINKKDSRQNKCKYRPILLFLLFGKVFEKILFAEFINI